MNFTLYKADKKDISLIRDLASKVWYHTYATVHTQEQLEYMFDQMYGDKELENQMNEGHTFYIVYNEDIPVGYMSIQQKE